MIPFFAFPPQVSGLIYTTDVIETSRTAQIRLSRPSYQSLSIGQFPLETTFLFGLSLLFASDRPEFSPLLR